MTEKHFYSWEDESKRSWGIQQDTPGSPVFKQFDDARIQIGCLQRIARTMELARGDLLDISWALNFIATSLDPEKAKERTVSRAKIAQEERARKTRRDVATILRKSKKAGAK